MNKQNEKPSRAKTFVSVVALFLIGAGSVGMLVLLYQSVPFLFYFSLFLMGLAICALLVSE